MKKILIYNIYQGGLDPELGRDRLPQIVHVIRSVKPDLVGILEADNWDQGMRLVELGEQTNLPYIFLARANTRHHLAWLSREPLQEAFSANEGFKHAVMGCRVSSICFAGAHLDPTGEDERLQEVERLQTMYSVNESVVLMGDLNSLSSHDPYDRERLLKKFQALQMKKFGLGRLRFDVMDRFEELGWIDGYRTNAEAYRSSFHTVPTAMNQDEAHASTLRLDYALWSPAVNVYHPQLTIVRSPEAEQASDHYPLLLTLDI